jgi:hypothetical protein
MIVGSAVLNGRMWIIGGGTYNTPTEPQRLYYNDVWSTPDGINWERYLEHTPWQPRQFHNVASWDGKLWVMGGWNGEQNLTDAWYSIDGVEWKEFQNTPWIARHAGNAFVFCNALWMVSGYNMQSDVWKLYKPN